MSEVELQRVTGLSSNDISSMKDTVARAAIKTAPVTGMELLLLFCYFKISFQLD